MKLRWLLPFLLILSLGGALFLFSPPFSLRMPWAPSRLTTVYSSLVESSRDSLLTTAEYSFKILFPYDFIEEGDKVPWKQLQRHYNYKREDPLSEAAPALWKYTGLYRICRESGLDPASDPLSFVVIEAELKAGVILPAGGLEQRREDFLILSGPEGKNVSLNLPAVGITDIIIIDRPAEGYGYPEVKMTPDQWSLLIKRMTPRIEDLAREKGLLREAEKGAVLLITDLFEGASFEVEEIRFSP